MQNEREREPDRDANPAEPRPGALARQVPDEVTEAMNQVVDEIHEPIDPFVAEAARRILERGEWQRCPG